MLKTFENEILVVKIDPWRKEVTGACRKLHNEELQNQYCSSYVTTLSSQETVVHIEHGGNEMCTIIWFENMKGRDSLRDVGINERIVSK
jgi:hypothetical protein